MKRLRLPISLALACVLIAAAAPAPAAAATATDRMVAGINWWRADVGVRPLYHSHRLHRSAERRSRYMIRRDVFAHPSRLSVPSFDRLGEVIALHSSRRARVVSTLIRWSHSPAHRRVLLAPHFRWVGAGRTTGRYNGRRTTMWVVRLGVK